MSLRRFPFDGAHALQLVGVVAAVVLAAVVNVLAGRHFTRWDWTSDKRWSLSPATVETLRSLDRSGAQVDLWAIVGPEDPIEESLRSMLASYTAASSRIDVHFIDPDRDAAQLIDLQTRFGLQSGRAEDGRIATDAVVVVASGEKHWFLTDKDLSAPAGDDGHGKPGEERALTGALRNVLHGDKAKLCFTVGHGELPIEPAEGAREWMGELRDRLEKDNYELASVDTTSPDAHEPFTGCTVAVVAGPTSAFSPEEANRLRAWLLQGGNLFAAVGPMDATSQAGLGSVGLADVLAPFGVSLGDGVVEDLDKGAAIPDTHGEGFFVSPRVHPVTASLVPGGAGGDEHPPKVAVFFARPLRHTATPGAASASDLLLTSAAAYAKTSVAGASTWADAPPLESGDPRGPFSLAMASERDRIGPGAPHGPRVVVVGSRFALADDNWRQPHALHGTAFLVDSALSWLAARPAVVDVPGAAEATVAMRISGEGRDEVRRYVLVLMPLAALLLGLAVGAWRRSSENAPYTSRVDGRGAGAP